MADKGGQLTFYFSHLPEGQERRKFVELGTRALFARDDKEGSQNEFIRYCIDFTKKHDEQLKRKIRKLGLTEKADA